MSAVSNDSVDSSCSIGNVDEDMNLLGNYHGQRQRKICKGIRKVKSKGAIVSLLLAFLAYGAFFSAFKMSTEMHDHTLAHINRLLPGIIGFAVFVVCCPVIGWLTDIRFSRYKVIRLGLWLMWVGSIAETVVLAVLTQYSHTKYLTCLTAVGIFFGCTVVPTGFAAVAANIVQFAIDQMPEASAEELSALIHWLTWAAAFSYSASELTQLLDYCVEFQDVYSSASIQILVPVSMLTAAICCTYLFRGWLTVEPENHNPLKNVFGVLKFAAVHKYPIMHSATTYGGDKKPTRIDFAKWQYGGPYRTEEVEDVKTFFRIVIVVASIALCSTPLLLYCISQVFISFHGNAGKPYDHINIHHACPEEVKWASFSPATFAVIMVPAYEVFFHPFLKNRLPKMLHRVGIAAGLVVILTGAIFIIDSVSHQVKPSLACMFQDTENVLNPYSPQIIIPLNFLVSVQLILYATATLEFTCAQSPYSMRGLLIGLFHSLASLAIPFVYAILMIWDKTWQQLPSKPSCDFYYFLFQFLYAVGVFLGLCVIVRLYKKRQREDTHQDGALVESVFERRLHPNCVYARVTQ